MALQVVPIETPNPRPKIDIKPKNVQSNVPAFVRSQKTVANLEQGSSLDWLINKESGGNPNECTGSHCGLGQLDPNARNTAGRKLGLNPDTKDTAEQRELMKSYISDRYGSVDAAVAHSKRHGWY